MRKNQYTCGFEQGPSSRKTRGPFNLFEWSFINSLHSYASLMAFPSCPHSSRVYDSELGAHANEPDLHRGASESLLRRKINHRTLFGRG